MKDKRLLNRRQWLRDTRGWGPQSSVHSDMSVGTNEARGKRKHDTNEINGSFGIRDCSNYVSIDIYAETENHYIKQHKAIDALIDELVLVRTAMVKGHDEVMKRGGWKCTSSKQ